MTRQRRPNARRQRRRGNGNGSVVNIVLSAMLKPAATAEKTVQISALKWTASQAWQGIIFNTYKVISVRITAMPGVAVSWRVYHSSSAPTLSGPEWLLQHPDTVHCFSTLNRQPSRVYRPVMAPYIFEQNANVANVEFNSGLHIAYVGNNATTTADTAALIATFNIKLFIMLQVPKPLPSVADEDITCEPVINGSPASLSEWDNVSTCSLV